jgi:hypothetical protein
MDLDNWIEKVKKCESLQEEELKALCEYVGALVLSTPLTLVMRDGQHGSTSRPPVMLRTVVLCRMSSQKLCQGQPRT